MMTSVHAEAEALRRAVQSGDFADAASSARRYVAALEAGLPQLPPAQAARHLKDACELTEWARRTLCAARARIRDELLRLERLTVYHETARPNTVSTWRIEG